MKKIVFFQTLLIAVVMFVSCSSTAGDFVSAYEEATNELASATSDDDCDKIHHKLMHKLYEITQEDPDWEKALADEDVQKAYDAWDEALRKAADNYAFMSFCTPENAIKHAKRCDRL